MPDGIAGPMHAACVAPGAGARTMPSGGPGAALRVGGFVPFTTTDFPGALAAVIFCQGCPWRCAYCHNPHLIPARADDGEGKARSGLAGEAGPDFARIRGWLDTRRGLLDAVVFSGGEPTAQPGLAAAVATVRELGFAIGLHTGGAYPRRLAEVLPQVDWVGFDVKVPFADYASVTGVEGSGDAALAGLDLMLGAGVAFDLRTTVHPALTPPDALERLAQALALRGIERWVLQPFRPTGCADSDLVAAAPRGVSLDPALLARLRAFVPTLEVLG